MSAGVFIGVCVGWLAWAGLVAWAALGSLRRDEGAAACLGDPASGLAVRVFRVYARAVCRLRVSGAEHVPDRGPVYRDPAAEPLVVVCNHTAGIDPALVQAALPFEPRWVMAEDMRTPALGWIWKLGRVIFTDRSKPDASAAREAIRHVRAGGVVGIFPEGHIERPPRHVLPMREGVGLIVLKTGAAVLPVVIDGTPQVDPAWASFGVRCRASVRFLPVRRYAARAGGGRWRASEVAEDIRRAFVEATGWPTSERTPMLRGGRRIMVGLDGSYVDERGETVDAALVDRLRGAPGSVEEGR